jgi:cysteine synthase A
VAATKLAKMLGPGHRIVTILCDRYVAFTLYETLLIFCSGARHLSKFWKNTEPVGGAMNDVSLEKIIEA